MHILNFIIYLINSDQEQFKLTSVSKDHKLSSTDVSLSFQTFYDNIQPEMYSVSWPT